VKKRKRSGKGNEHQQSARLLQQRRRQREAESSEGESIQKQNKKVKREKKKRTRTKCKVPFSTEPSGSRSGSFSSEPKVIFSGRVGWVLERSSQLGRFSDRFFGAGYRWLFKRASN